MTSPITISQFKRKDAVLLYHKDQPTIRRWHFFQNFSGNWYVYNLIGPHAESMAHLTDAEAYREYKDIMKNSLSWDSLYNIDALVEYYKRRRMTIEYSHALKEQESMQKQDVKKPSARKTVKSSVPSKNKKPESSNKKQTRKTPTRK